MGESLTTIVVILLAAILMFIFPMMAMSERNDDVSELTVQTAIAEFVNNTRNKGKITNADYDKLVSDLYATGNTYDISMEIQVFDENPAKKKGTGTSSITTSSDAKIGENIYYSIYTSQIMDELNNNGVKYMKKGDMLKVSASNTNNTLSQMLKNFFYGLTGNDVYSITGSHSGTVTVTGSK